MILASQLSAAPSDPSAPADPTLEAEALEASDNPADYLIRANQGHSINVDTEGLLTEISEQKGNVPATVVHGTDEAALDMILLGGGLRRMGRTHIHFASGLPAGFRSADYTDGAPVISGMRKSATILIYVDIAAALAAGIKFFVSENGVILTVGDEEEEVLSYKFFKRVESRRDGRVVMRDGVLPEGVSVDVEEWKKVDDVTRQSGGSGRGRGGRGGGRGARPRATDDSRDLMADAQ